MASTPSLWSDQCAGPQRAVKPVGVQPGGSHVNPGRWGDESQNLADGLANPLLASGLGNPAPVARRMGDKTDIVIVGNGEVDEPGSVKPQNDVFLEQTQMGKSLAFSDNTKIHAIGLGSKDDASRLRGYNADLVVITTEVSSRVYDEVIRPMVAMGGEVVEV